MKRLCTDVYAVSKTSCVNNQTIFEEKLPTEHQMCKTISFFFLRNTF